MTRVTPHELAVYCREIKNHLVQRLRLLHDHSAILPDEEFSEIGKILVDAANKVGNGDPNYERIKQLERGIRMSMYRRNLDSKS